MVALHKAMAWPTWRTIWLSAYPKLANISWAPGATVNNTINDNVAVGRGILGYGPPLPQYLFHHNHSAVFPSHGNWNGSDLSTALFVAQDPIHNRDFRLKANSPVFAASGGAFQQIPRGQGPRPPPTALASASSMASYRKGDPKWEARGD